MHKFEITAILIFGQPDYYPRVGFRRAAEFGITTADGNNFDAFMVLLFYDNTLEGIKGRYFIDPVYDNLNEQDVLDFENFIICASRLHDYFHNLISPNQL
jgi:hypothetical protein